MEDLNFIGRRGFLSRFTGLGALLFLGFACEDLGADYSVYIVNANKCTGCQDCLKACTHSAISFSGTVAVISATRCSGCGKCVSYCKQNAISQS